MKTVLLGALVIVNVLLLVNLVSRLTRDDVAEAQAQQPPRRISDYLLVPMEQSNGQSGLVCVIDENAGQMAAVAYNGRNGLDVMSPVNLVRPAPPRANYNNGRGY
ncbi:MAG TPA: hypothetical protein VG722_12830 [Tepidisphaeraceae bacterium]|nr:hypothetical protein [Tepidisphaeraceae bacterium]